MLSLALSMLAGDRKSHLQLTVGQGSTDFQGRDLGSGFIGSFFLTNELLNLWPVSGKSYVGNLVVLAWVARTTLLTLTIMPTVKYSPDTLVKHQQQKNVTGDRVVSILDLYTCNWDIAGSSHFRSILDINPFSLGKQLYPCSLSTGYFQELTK